jgi:hypothetical protein
VPTPPGRSGFPHLALSTFHPGYMAVRRLRPRWFFPLHPGYMAVRRLRPRWFFPLHPSYMAVRRLWPWWFFPLHPSYMAIRRLRPRWFVPLHPSYMAVRRLRPRWFVPRSNSWDNLWGRPCRDLIDGGNNISTFRYCGAAKGRHSEECRDEEEPRCC